MKTLLRTMLRFCVCFSLLISLTGCHNAGKTTDFVVPEKFDTSRDYEITFWAKNDTNKTQTNIYEKAIHDFEKLYPNIHVTIRLYTNYGTIYNDVITNIATNTTPNVCITYPDHIATYLTGADTVVDLGTLMDNTAYGFGGSEVPFDSPKKEDIIPAYLEEGVLNRKQYALPFMRSTEACYVNEDYVRALGFEMPEELTWDFIWEVSEAAMAQNSDGTYVVNGQNVMIPFIYKSTDNMMITMLKQKNAGYSDEDGNVEIFNDTTKNLLETISNHAATGAFSTFHISGYPANFLNAGQCIFAIDSTAGATWMGSHAPLSDISEEAFVDFHTGVYPVPQFDVSNPKMMSQGPSICLFNKKDPQEVLASWLFTQYLLTNDVQIPYAETEGYVPITSKAQNAQEYKDYLAAEGTDDTTHYDVKIEATKLLLNHIDHTFVTPVFNGSASLRNAAGELVEDAVKATRRHKEINDAFFEETFEDVTSLYRLNQIKQNNKDAISKDLGPLPMESKALIGILIVIWIGILIYFFNPKKHKKTN